MDGLDEILDNSPGVALWCRMTSRARTPAIPTFYLYGEPRRSVDERFVHIEALDDRSRPSEWTIRPHAHAELNHIFHISAGGGAMWADSRTVAFGAPCLLLVPAGIVHGFEWQAETAGVVVTLATTYLTDAGRRDRALADLFVETSLVRLGPEDSEAMARALTRLALEMGWAAPGHVAAADACALQLLVTILRLSGRERDPVSRDPPVHAALVARLRERIEARFRSRESVEDQASALGVSSRRLRTACAAVARQSPSQMLDERALLEAKRLLIYGNLSVAEISHALGFDDPAYFSRFFLKRTGRSPKAWRMGFGKA